MNIVFCGPPGAGKGTQSSRLARQHDLYTISTGDLVREVAKADTELGRSVAQTLEAGRLLSDGVVLSIIKQAVEEVDMEYGLLFDGFPRTLEQASDLMTLLRELKRDLDHVIILRVERSVIEKRLTGRFICSSCAAVYNEYYKPTQEQGVCDLCSGSAFERRTDDTAAVVKRRLDEYDARVEQITAYYDGLGVARFVDGHGAVSEVSERIDKILEGEV